MIRPDDAPPSELLAQHRRDIEALDRRILHLVCERLELARQIGELKGRLGIPLRNFRVETEVYRRFEQASQFLGLHSELGHDLARLLIDKAVEAQATMRDGCYAGDALDAVVVGGKGGMGRWIARFLAGQGHRVRVVDPGPGETVFPELVGVAEARSADLVMLAVPMSACSSVVTELAEAGATGVVAEMCSLKGHLTDSMAQARGRGLRLVSFHPLFGPDVRMLEGRTIVFCTEGSADDVQVVRSLFAETSARLVDMDLAEHDRCMGLVLGMTHLANLVYARAVMRSGVPAKRLAEVAGVTFDKQMRTTREVVSENPDLYFEIQALNALTPTTGSWLRDSMADWLGLVEAGDEAGFSVLMKACREGLEPLGGSLGEPGR